MRNKYLISSAAAAALFALAVPAQAQVVGGSVVNETTGQVNGPVNGVVRGQTELEGEFQRGELKERLEDAEDLREERMDDLEDRAERRADELEDRAEDRADRLEDTRADAHMGAEARIEAARERRARTNARYDGDARARAGVNTRAAVNANDRARVRANANSAVNADIDSSLMVRDYRNFDHGAQVLVDGQGWVWVPSNARLDANGRVVAR